QIAAPCTASWDEMEGSDRVRFCKHCQRHVYSLSALSRREAEQFVREREGRACVRFYRRADGTMLTADCPVGLRALRRVAKRNWALLFSGLCCTISLFVGGAFYSTGELPKDRSIRGMEPFATIWDLLAPPQPEPPEPTPPPPPCRPTTPP